MSVRQHLQQLSVDTLFYGLGAALQGSVVLLLFPLYTRLLTQEEFGAQDLVASAVTVLLYLLGLGLDSGAARHYYDATEADHRRAVLSTWLWFQLLFVVPMCAILIALAPSLCALAFDREELAPYLRIGVASIPFYLTARVATMTLRLTFQAKKFSILAGLGATAEVATAIVLVAVLRLGLHGVFLTMVIASAVQMAVGLALTQRQFGPILNGRLLRSMLAFGVPLVPASLSLWILNYSNRTFLTRMATLSDVGVLGVAVRIAAVISLLNAAFQYAWPPFAYSLLGDRELARQTYARVLTVFLLVTLLVTVGLTVFAREALLILAPAAYQSAAALVPWLCFGIIAWGVAGIAGIGFEIAKKSYHFSIATIFGALTTTGLNLVLIRWWGITGAALATMFGNVVALSYAFSAGQHYFRVGYEGRKIGAVVTLAVLAVAAALILDRSFVTWRADLILYKLLVVVSFVAGLFVLRVIRPADLAGLRRGRDDSCLPA